MTIKRGKSTWEIDAQVAQVKAVTKEAVEVIRDISRPSRSRAPPSDVSRQAGQLSGAMNTFVAAVRAA